MITQVKIPILAPDNFRITPDMAYNLYGTWMSLLAPEQSDYLHQSRAMNHYLLPNGKNSAVLTVNLLAEETADFMIPLFEKTREYHLTKYNCTLAAQEPQMQRFGEDDFVKPYFTSPRFHRRVTLHLMTPTTFKTKNHYAVFSNARADFAKRSGKMEYTRFRRDRGRRADHSAVDGKYHDYRLSAEKRALLPKERADSVLFRERNPLYSWAGTDGSPF
jgi:hypothetical protein